jgi:hypothetical protein
MGKEKLREKVKLLTKVANILLADKERIEKERLGPQKKIKKAPTAAQKAVQDRFAKRAQIASRLYNSEGAGLSWAEAMTSAGPLMEAMDSPDVKGDVTKLTLLENATEEEE